MTQAGSLSRRLGLLGLKLALAFFSVVLVVFVFELGFRLAGYQTLYEIYSKPSLLWRTDPLLGWSHIPNSRDVFIGPRPWPIEFRTPIEINSLGLRGPEVPPRSEDDVRVLFVGDSMVAGMEVDYDKTFPVLIAKALSDRTGLRVRAINAGVRGYGSDQSYLYFRDRGRDLESDVVVFFYSHNDLENNVTLHRMRRPMSKAAFFVDDEGQLELVGSPVVDYPICSSYSVGAGGKIVRLDGLIGRSLCATQMVLFDRSALFSFITLRISWNPALLRNLYYLAIPTNTEGEDLDAETHRTKVLTLKLLDALHRDVESSGARLVVTGQEKQLEKDLGLDTIRGMGITVSPIPTPSDEEEPQFHFERDSHYNVRGHERVAREILPDVEAAVRAQLNLKGAR